jgi:phosphoribosyl 1,2-cyclic phosphodiesterase
VRFASLGSGSRGNATLIEYAETCLLLDCGFTVKETELRLQNFNKSPADLAAIVVTHEHSDHIKGVGALARKYKLPVYMTSGTYQSGRFGNLTTLNLINSHKSFQINQITVHPIPVPHDAREPCQFVFQNGKKRLGVLTDLGSITPYVRQQYTGLDALLLECNHDPDLLREGPYPYPLKQRILGDYGHLSNAQAAQLLGAIDIDSLQHLVVSHISQQNNTVEHVSAELMRAIPCGINGLKMADQDSGFDWCQIT